MPQVDRAGIFKAAPPTEYALEKSKEGAWGVRFRFDLTHYLNGSEWVDWSVYGQHAYGTVWFIRKDGKPNDRGVETLRDVLGWDGNPDSIENKTWQPPACQVVVKADEYDGKTRFRVEWINPLDHQGAGLKGANDSDVADLKARFGATLRALFGTQAVKAPKPNGKPLPPPPSRAPAQKSAPPAGSKERAWAAFCATNASHPKPLDHDELTAEWVRIMAELFGNKPEAEFTPADWARMEKEGPAGLIPF